MLNMQMKSSHLIFTRKINLLNVNDIIRILIQKQPAIFMWK